MFRGCQALRDETPQTECLHWRRALRPEPRPSAFRNQDLGRNKGAREGGPGMSGRRCGLGLVRNGHEEREMQVKGLGNATDIPIRRSPQVSS